MRVYLYDDHEEGNPECGRCQESIAAFGAVGVTVHLPARCTAIVSGARCAGYCHVDAEVLRPGGNLWTDVVCDACGGGEWDPES